MDTRALDMAYLEWSQFTTARTGRELALMAAVDNLIKACDSGNAEQIAGARRWASQVLNNSKVTSRN